MREVVDSRLGGVTTFVAKCWLICGRGWHNTVTDPGFSLVVGVSGLTPEVGVQFFAKNYMKMKEFGSQGGTRDVPMQHCGFNGQSG